MNLQWFTVYARLIRDNKHGSTGNPDLLDVVRWHMSQKGFDPSRVTWSTALPRPSLEGFDCGSVYGDSARVYETSALIAAIAGGDIGHPADWNVMHFLGCGGTIGSVSAETKMMMHDGTGVYHTQPGIIDAHFYPCVAQTNEDRDCNLNKNAFLKDEARLTFNAIRAMIASYGPSGWRGFNSQIYNSIYVLGETHSNTNNGALSCELAPLNAPADTVTGFNQSTLGGTTLAIVRPWENHRALCYPLTPTINPPYTPAP